MGIVNIYLWQNLLCSLSARNKTNSPKM